MENTRRIIVDKKEKATPKYEEINEEEFKKYSENSNLECPSIKDAMTDAEDQFIKFVSAQIEKMDNHLIFDGKAIPTLAELSSEICKHAHIMLALTGLYEEARWELNAAKESYDLWYSSKFMEIRNEVNRDDLAKAKWYSASEIDMMVKCKYKSEIKKLKADTQLAESKKSMLQRLIDEWNNYSFQLQQLSKNAIAEYSSVQKEAYIEN